MSGALSAMIAAAFAGGGAPPVVSDPYFEYTTLLLPGNGTNGAQNNTFLDSSANNFTITRNGNTTQGTFSPFSQTGWGNYFNGGYLTTASSNAVLPTGTQTYSLEFFVYVNGVSGSYNILVEGSTSANGFQITYFNDGSAQQGKLGVSASGVGAIVTATFSSYFNRWVHVVATRSGNDHRLFFDGVLVAYASNAISFAARGTQSFGAQASGALPMNGYMSNVRACLGSIPTSYQTSSTTVSTIIFSVPTESLTNTSQGATSADVELRTCQSNRFVDNSGNNYTLNTGGTPSVQAFSPFNPSASWSAATNGGSGYFDGNGDYLSVADNSNLRLGTNAFTIQGWVYRNASGAAHSIIAKGGASTGFVLQVTSTNILRFTHGTTNVDTTTTIPASAWTHIAAVRTNTSTNGFQLYINGVSSATATVSTDFNQTDTLYAGADRSAANVMNGFISGLKYTNGTAESIAVPTEPPTATTNVALLLNFTNAGIYDATSKNDLETVGDAKISTAQSKWGGSSMAFDGTGDWLLIPDQPIQRIGTGNFTIEGWVYRNSSGTYGLIGKGTGTTGWLVSLNSSNQVVFTYGSSTITSTGTVSATTWTHIAVVREGTSTNQTKIYINGTNDGTGTVSTDFNQTNSMYVGADRTGGSAANAYMQDVRVTNYARYTSNFTAPTAAFPTL